MKKKIKKALVLCLSPFLKLLLIVLSEVEIRNLFGGIYCLSRDGAHEIAMRQIRDRYDIDPSARWGLDTLIYGEGKIIIGEATYFGRNCMVVSNLPFVKIVIGCHCSISHNVQIRTEKHKRSVHFKDEKNSPMQGADVIIGDYVWIGANVFIKGGVVIGDNSIVGANSVVTSDIPSDAIYGGVPARLIRLKSEYLKK